jgi:cobalt/nickel transport system permease protein
MHIPDGYLSPQTYVPLYIIFIAIIGAAIRKVKKKLTTKIIPFLGMSAAFSFLIMMFNIPVPGGTTGHAVGAALIALLFGPWIAIVSVSVAIILQAFVFGDGGITAIGANCFNMAIVMPFIAYGVFKLINQHSVGPKRMGIAAFLAGYVSLCFAALMTAVEVGIQPIVASSNGIPLYAPYPLKVAIPAMALEHLLLFGIVEGLITALLFRYFYHSHKDLIEVLK